MARDIPLTRGFVALVDDEDHAELSKFKWCIAVEKGGLYAKRGESIDGRKRTVRMHRFILGAPPGVEVDHINHDGLDNRRANLRLATSTQNKGNTRKRRDGFTSRFKGVCWHQSKGRWQARIKQNRRMHHLGYFDSEEAAARAYDAAAREYFGEFALVNFPEAA